MDKGAPISKIQRYSINDGPGIRSTVFFKGCSLQCKWCCNPELIDYKQEIMRNTQYCIQCGDCIKNCLQGAIRMNEKYTIIDRSKCDGCGKCVDVCPMNVYELVSKRYSVDKLVSVLLRDKIFYETSGGGVTFSGGEPLLYVDFLYKTSLKLRQRGIRIAVETSGNVEEKAIDKALKVVDLFLYDIKILDPNKHKEQTGESNKKILKNIIKVSESGIPIIVRLLIIPGINNNGEAQKRIEFARSLKNVIQVDLLKYHCLGKGKYLQLDRDYRMIQVDKNADKDNFKKEMMQLKKYSESMGLKATISS